MVVVAAIVGAWALLWPLTDLIAAHDVGRIAGPQRAVHLQSAHEAVRTQLLTLAAGIFVAGALWFTAQNYRLSRQGQVTDRYTKAIEQLGSDKLDVRIGAIYALERIARDSARDHPTVMEVLAAFVREHSSERRPPQATDSAGTREPDRPIRPDVQAAATVIGRRNPRDGRQRVDLTSTDLRRADLTSADLAEADLTSADLRRANLIGANLTGAVLWIANLAGAVLWNVNLAGALLWNANLTGADLREANLTGANLTGANLTEANLQKVNLRRANLTNAVFTGANLSGANLSGANLTEAQLYKAKLGEAEFAGANLNTANLPDATGVAGAHFRGADLTGAWFPLEAIPEGWQVADTGRLVRITGDPNGDARDVTTDQL